MKVLIVTPYFYPKVGGLENYALNIAIQLQRHGNEVIIVTSNHERTGRIEDNVNGLKVIRLPIQFRLSNTPFSLSWKSQIKKIISNEKPDVINAHLPVPFIADMAVRAAGKTPVVLTYHNDLVKSDFLGRILSKAMYLLLINKTLKKTSAIIATSEYYINRSPYLKRYKYKTSVVSPGVDLRIYNKNVDDQWLKAQYPGKTIILFVGNMSKTHMHKGVDILIKSLKNIQKNIPNVILVAVGSGDAIPIYENIAISSGVKEDVVFVGHVTDQELPKYYAGANVLVLPSTSEAEGFGMVIMEAAACGTPSVGSRVGGIPYAIVNNDTGVLIEQSSVDDLAKGISNLLNSPDKLKKLGVNAANRAKKDYGWDSLSVTTSNVLKRVMLPSVVIIHNVISPYRLALFEELNRRVRLTVLFCKPITKDRVWKYDLAQYSFNYELLKGFSIGPIIFNAGARKSLNFYNPDVVITNSDPDTAPITLLTILIARTKHVSIIMWSEVIDKSIHFFPSLAYSNSPIKKALRALLSNIVQCYRRVCFLFADRFLAFSKASVQFLQLHSIKPDDIIRTYEIIPQDQLSAINTIKHKKSKHLSILYVGYLIKRKGVDLLIDAFKDIKNSNISLIIAGSGPEETELKFRAANDDRISFPGYVEGKRKAGLYLAADIFVLPTRGDCWGLVINEAVYYGLAIVCSESAGASEIVSEERGVIVKTESAESIQKALELLINNPKKTVSMQKRNLGDASVTDVIKAVDGFEKAIMECIR